MKNYQKAEMIAKNLPTGSYAAGCPVGTRSHDSFGTDANGNCTTNVCSACEIAH